MNTSQFMYIVVTLYFSYKLCCLFTDTMIGMALGALGILASFYVWFGIMPSLLDSFTLTTSVSCYQVSNPPHRSK